MEHAGIWMGLKVSVPTLNQQVNLAGMARAMLQWLAGKGPAANPTAQAVGFARTMPELTSPDIQLHRLLQVISAAAATAKLAPFPMVSVVASVSHPAKPGTDRSGEQRCRRAPLIFPRLLDAPEDMATLRRGIELCARIVDAPAFRGFVLERISWPDLDAGDAEVGTPDSRACRADLSAPSARAGWARTPRRWSIRSSRFAVSRGCSSPMPRSCLAISAETPRPARDDDRGQGRRFDWNALMSYAAAALDLPARDQPLSDALEHGWIDGETRIFGGVRFPASTRRPATASANSTTAARRRSMPR